MDKKAIGQVVATTLLIVVTVVTVVGFQGWFGMYSSNIFSNTEIKNSAIFTGASIENIINGKLYIKSPENNSLKINKILVNGVDCYIEQEISGIEDIFLEICLQNLTTSSAEVTIITDNEVITKQIYIPLEEIPELRKFISVWNTSESGSDSNKINLPLESDGTYNFYVTGEDLIGSPVHITNYTDNVLTFSSEGIQEIIITGKIKGFNFMLNSDKAKLYEIKSWGPLNLGNKGFYFVFCQNFDFTGSDSLDLTGTTNLMNAFNYCSNFNGNISSWDVSKVTDMSGVFFGATKFNQPLNSWDVNNVKDMKLMFKSAENFNQDLNNWDVSSVESMYSMFGYTYEFNGDISSWNLSSLKTMEGMFIYAKKFNGNISSWNTNNVENMRMMFFSDDRFNQDLSNWNTSSVINMEAMFHSANMFNQDLTSWEVNKVNECSDFNLYSNLNLGNLPNFTNCTI